LNVENQDLTMYNTC